MKSLVYLIAIPFMFSCAQYAAPTGGKKDEKGPKLEASIPKNQTKNFKGNTILLQFDELLETSSLKQELIITPQPEGNIDVKNKGKEVSLHFTQPLKDSTTYTLNFRNGIKDLTERNPSENLKLIFSTGKEIDSMSVSGSVQHAYSLKPAINCMVALYPIADTFNLKKSKPYYFTKTDSSGVYSFQNLRAISYRVFAFEDKNNNLLFDEKTEEGQLVRDTLYLTKNIQNQNFKIFKQDTKPTKVLKTQNRTEQYIISLDETPLEVKILSSSHPYLIHQKANTITLYNHTAVLDSIKTELQIIDSSQNVLTQNFKFKFKKEDKKTKPEYFDLQLKNPLGLDIENTKSIIYSIPEPVLTIDTTKIIARVDSLQKISLKTFKLSQYQTQIEFTDDIKFKKTFQLTFEKGAIISASGDSSVKKDQIFKKINPENYAQLEGNLLTTKPHQLIVQLLNENLTVAKEQIVTHQKFTFQNIKEGTYFVRVIIDTDHNNKWTTGSIENCIEAEKIKISNEIKLKSNFEIKGFDIDLTTL